MQRQTYLLGHAAEVQCLRPEAEGALHSTSRQLNLTEVLLLLAHLIDIHEGRQIPTTPLHQLLQTLAVSIPLVSFRLRPRPSLLDPAPSLQVVLQPDHVAALRPMHRPGRPPRVEARLLPALLPAVTVSAVALARPGTK